MKRLFQILVLCTLTILAACKKDEFNTDSKATIIVAGGADTILFDTVFTSLGSVTHGYTIVNPNNQKIAIDKIELYGKENSPFSINVNGRAGTSFSDLTVLKNDSIYLFIKVRIDPTNAQLPFIVQDSIQFAYNNQVKKLYLAAYGKNAHFINGGSVTKDTTWTKQLPIVLLKPLYVNPGTHLTITEGVQVYNNANAALVVNGRLTSAGTVQEPITFTNDRLDAPYSGMPGSWGGIIINNGSRASFEQTNILNAYQALVAMNGANIVFNNSTIHNAYDFGLMGINATIASTNARITQCGNNGVLGTGGSNVILVAGNYTFNHSTIATYSNSYQNLRQPVFYASNFMENQTAPLSLNINNSIIYSEGGLAENSIVIQKGNDVLTANFNNVMYSTKKAVDNASFNAGSFTTTAPLFDSISTARRYYNFRLRENSPAVDKASATALNRDILGVQRPKGSASDLGAYESF
ncbi:choice-of-anchor Q domain-containing protein [Polluticaenibacter yanchengensis]|uniref:Right-handed parallel beta-helix repeat-containing protein n=1 Tax=Polluticaenibacter yanchengensis TaxID=3014562 RepID=A0ABT4UL80_9BACT|nr:hypothetical protein [Chitinophagaceae bacterium LY-5]